MGKIKTKRFKPKKPNPTGLLSAKDIKLEEEEEVDEAFSDSYISNIIAELQSKGKTEKCCACNKLSYLTNKTKLSAVFQSDIVKILAPMIVNRSRLVQHAAIGALRNLSVAGGVDGCDKLVQNDLMTPLVHLFKKYGMEWTLSKRCIEKGKLDHEADIFVQACYLLFNLSENSSICVKIFNSEHLLPILIRCLNYEEFTIKVAIAVGHCLHIISEDNPKFVEDIQEFIPNIEKLQEIEEKTPEMVLLRTLISGILLNIEGGCIDSCSDARIAFITKTVSQTLDLNYYDFAKKVIAELKEPDELETENYALNVAVEVMETVLTAQQISLEIFTNVCSSTDEEWDVSSSSSEDMPDQYMEKNEEDMDTVPSSFFTFHVQVEEALTKEQIAEKIIMKLDTIDEDILNKLNNCKDTSHLISRINMVKCRALSCYHNLVMGLDVSQLGGAHALYLIWCALGNQAFKKSGLTDLSLMESYTSVLRAMLQKLLETQNLKDYGLNQMTAGEIQVIYETGLKCKDGRVRVNVVRIFGSLGSYFAGEQNSDARKHLKCIGEIILEVCLQDNDLWVVGEALDACFDVFAEDETDAVAVEIRLVEKLSNFLPQLKYKMKTQRKKLSAEQWAVIVTSKSNLTRFLKYKKNPQKHSKEVK